MDVSFQSICKRILIIYSERILSIELQSSDEFLIKFIFIFGISRSAIYIMIYDTSSIMNPFCVFIKLYMTFLFLICWIFEDIFH